MKKILLILLTIVLILSFNFNVLAYSAIDIGSPAIDRPSSFHPAVHTAVNKDNPANAAGTITKVQIWASEAMTAVEIGIFYDVGGDRLSTRSWQDISDLSIGFNEVDVSLACEVGDYIGIEYVTGNVDRDPGGYAGTWTTSAYNIPCINGVFTPNVGDTGSLCAIGEAVPNQVTGVLATDGVHTDKVVVTWDVAAGADKYYCWNGSSWIDRGTNLFYDHTGAPAPTITAGTASASDGTSSEYVTLSIAGESANVGSSISYKVKAWNVVGYGADSASDSGYRGVGDLTYQWQRSAEDSDADYSPIDGATTDPYNDTGAPADGSGRYYKCVENATGATQVTTNADRGYRIPAGITWNGVIIIKWNNITVGDINTQ